MSNNHRERISPQNAVAATHYKCPQREHNNPLQPHSNITTSSQTCGYKHSTLHFSCLSPLRALLLVFLLATFCTQSLAVSQVNIASAVPITLQEGQQVSVSLVRTGTTSELETTTTVLMAIEGSGASSDFSSAILVAFFNAGASVSSVFITVNQDSTPEIDEDFSLQIRTALGSNIGPNNALNITVLLSDDPYGVLSFSSDSITASAPEPSDAATNPTLTVVRVGAFGEVNVQWRFIGDASLDFSTTQGAITFPDQVDSVSLPLAAIRDEVMEPDEVFQIELFSVDGGARLSSTNTVATLTLTRNDIPVYLSCSQTSVTEDFGTISCDVTRGLDADGNPVGSFSHDSTLTISTVGLSATSQSDFLAISSSITFAANVTRQSIEVTIIDDSAPEDDETFQVRIRTPSPDIHVFTPEVNLTIFGNDGAGGVVSLPDLDDVIAMEGDNAKLRISRSESTVGVVTVSWEASHRISNSSIAIDDIITPGSSSIPDGDSQADLLVSILSDGTPEAAEPFLVRLTSITSNIGRLASSQLNESFIVRDSDSAYGLLEWSEAGHVITVNPRILSLRLDRKQGVEFNIVVNYNVSYVPAGGGIDTQIQNYVTTPGITVINDGRDHTIINLTIADNAFLEAQGRFYASLQSASILRTGVQTLLVEPPSSPTIGVRDKLFIPIPEYAINGRIGFTDASRRISVEEGTSSQPTSVNLTIERDGSSGQATINYAIVPATAGNTFTADDLEQNLVGTVVLPEGESSVTLTILIRADSLPEVAEEFVVSLLSAAEPNQQVNGPASASYVTIRVSDTPGGTISLSAASVGPFIVTENSSDIVMLTLERSGASLTNEIVQYEITSNGPQDFYASGFEIINSDQTSKALLVLPFDDTIPELEETFNLTIIRVSENAILGEPSQSMITILENDYPYGLFQFQDLTQTISETNPTATDPSQYNTAQFRVKRDRGTFGNVSVEWRIAQSNAGYDVTPTSGALSFTAGEVYSTISISVIPDDVPEGVEIFTIELHSPTGGAVVQQSQAQAQLSISANDDPITFTRVILDVDESPGSRAQVSITRGGQALDRATVKLMTREDSAKQSEDFNPYVDFLIIFEPGEREMSVSTDILNDDIPEIEERFYFVLYDATGNSVVYSPNNVSVYIGPNDDPNGIVSFHPSSLRASGEEGRSTGLLIQRTRGTFGRLIIFLNVTGISIGHPNLPPSPGDLSFANGVIMQDRSANTTVSIQVLDDNIPELEDTFQISIICPIFGSQTLTPGPTCASENLTVTFTVPENDDPYGAYGWSADSLDVFVAEDLPEGAPSSERERTLTISQYGGTLAGAELIWELTAPGLEGVALADLIFLGTPGSGVSVHPSRSDTGTTAYLFSGQNSSFISVPTQYQPTATDISGGFTISAFIRGSSSSAGYVVVKHSSDLSITYYGVRIRVSGSISYLRYEYTLTSSGSISSLEAELPTTAFNGFWSHLAAVHEISPSPGVRLYFRGVQLRTQSVGTAGILEDSSGVLSVGATGSATDAISGIALQDVRVYYAPLDSAQISSISLTRPTEDVSPISGYASFSIGQTNSSTPLIRVKEDNIPEATEVVYPRVLNIKGSGRVLPVEGVARFSILASETGNGIFEFQSLQPVSLTSEADTASIAISRSFSLLGGVYVHWAVYRPDGYTLAAEDFTPASGRHLISAGEGVSNLELTAVDDQVPELAESYIVSLTGLSSEDGTTPSTSTSAHYLRSSQNISLRIEDNDDPYGLLQFHTSGIPVADGQFIPAASQQPAISVLEEFVNISLQVVRAQGTVGDISVQYFTSSLDADGIGSDRDYVNAVGQITFSSGQRSQFINIVLVDDSLPELAESFQVILSNPTGAMGTPSVGIGSIINITIYPSDDAFGVLAFTTESLSRVVSEEDVTLTLNLQRTGGLLSDVTLQWVLQGSNGPTDITPSSGFVFFNESVNSGSIQLGVVQDEISEFLEVFQVQLVNVTGGARLSSLGDTQASISIQASDYPHGLFNFPQGQRSVTVQEGSTFTLTINRQFGSIGDIRVNFSTSAATSHPATPNLDYTQVENGYVDFISGVTTRAIEITVLQDDIPEIGERFDVLLVGAQLLSAPQPGMPTPAIDSGAASKSEVTISENDDARGVFSFISTQLSVSEPASGFLYVQRRAGVFGIVAVAYTVTLVTAIVSDLSSLNGQVTFTEGTNLVALPLSVADDLNPEFDETFTVTLTSPTGGARLAASNTSTLVTIFENDDIHGVFEFATGSRLLSEEEPLSNPLTVELVLERREGAEGVVRITWEAMLSNGESAASDVAAVSGELLYQSQERSKTFSIQILPDTIPEGLEGVVVMIASVTGGARAGDASTATVNILPNDAPHGVVTFSSAQFMINETEETSVARIPLNRQFGNLGDLQVTYYTTQFNILDLAFSNPNTTESDYFTDSQPLMLTDAQDELQRSNLNSSSNPFIDCARLCISSFTCNSLSHSSSICILYKVTKSQTTSTASSFRYYEKRTDLTEPLQLSIASDGGDYIGTPRSDITIPDGVDTGYIEVTIIADTVPEFGEWFGITLTSLSLLNMSVANPVNIPTFGNIVETRVEISRSDFPNGLFRVALSGNIQSLVVPENFTELITGTIYRDYGTIGAVSVHYSLVGSATSVEDFGLAEATFVFNPGETQKPFSFLIREDNIAEGDETIIIHLDDPMGGAEIVSGVGSAATIQIDANDNGGGLISFAVESLSSVVEEGRVNFVRIIRKVGAAGMARVTWILTGSGSEEEFSTTNGSALFQDGFSYAFIELVPRNDTLPETPKVYNLTITGVQSVDIAETGGAILDPDTSLLTAVVTLAESDMPHGVVELTSNQLVYTQLEGTASSILVSRKFGTIGNLRLSYVSEVGNLTTLNPVFGPQQRALASESDFVTEVQTLLIADGVTSLTFTLTVTDDIVPEFAEVFILRLVSVELLNPPPFQPAALKPPTLGANNRAEIYIPQNDGPQGFLQFLVGSLEVLESAGKFNVTVERASGNFGPASCRIELTGVPSSLPIATRDADYLFQSVEFSWADGELGTRTFEVEIIEDSAPESREAIHIGITQEAPSGVARGENATLTIIILGSDLGRGIFTIDPNFPMSSFVKEGDTLLVPILRSFSSLGEVLLQYRVLPATLPADLSPVIGQVQFQDGQTRANLRLDVVLDGIAELVEQFTVEILSPVSPEGTMVVNRTSVQVHVSLNDNPYGRFEVFLLQPSGQRDFGKALVGEDDGLVQVVIERSDGQNREVSVDFQLTPLSATSNSPGDQYTLSTTQRLPPSSEWLSFVRDGDSNQYAISVDGSTSRLFRWRGIYEEIQTFSVSMATSWQSFSWNNSHYLAVSSYDTSIQLFIYNSTSSFYYPLQSLSHPRASHLHSFSTEGQLYLFASIFSDDTGNTDMNSLLFEWDGTLFNEQPIQQLVTRGAKHALTFVSNNTLYLAVANSYDSAQQTSDTPSVAYQWSATNIRFERVSSISTSAATSLSITTDADGAIYLLSINDTALLSFSWSGQEFSSLQQFYIAGNVSGVQSILFQSTVYVFVSVIGRASQLYRLSSGQFFPLQLAVTPAISSSDLAPVEIEAQLFVLAAIAGTSQSLLLALGRWREGADFFERRGTLTFSQGQSSLTQLVELYPDDLPEVTEGFVVRLSNPTNEAVLDNVTSNLTVRILANDNAHGLIGFSPSSQSVILPELSEQDLDRRQDFTLDVIRRGGTFGDVVVKFVVTGEAVEDIIPTQSTITLVAGSNATTLPLRIIDDMVIELAEAAQVVLTEIVSDGNTDPDVSSSRGAQLDPATSSASVTIQANDYPHGLLTFSVSSRDVTVDEPAADNLTSVTLTIIREFGLNGAININIETQTASTYPPDQQAQPGEDFTATSSQVTMQSGGSVATVTVSILPDLTPETTETFWVRIVSATLQDESDRQGSLSDSPRPKNLTLEVAEVRISPNDEFRGILIFDVSLSQDGTLHVSESAGILNINVNRTSGTFGEIGASWRIEPISASPTDFSPISGSVSYSDGQATSQIQFRLTDDAIPEMSTTFRLLLHSPTGGARLGESELVITIDESDDVHGLFLFAQESELFSLQEPGENATQPSSATFVVMRTRGLLGEVVISWEVESAATGDVTPLSGQLIYPENVTTADFKVSLVDDSIAELDVTYQIRLVSATNGGNIAETRSVASIFILANDNPTGRISISPTFRYVVVAEGSSIRLELNRTQGAFYRVNVQWELLPAFATQHFLTQSETAVFDVGATTAFIQLQTITDDIPESAQIFTLHLRSANVVGSNVRAVLEPGADRATVVVAASNQPHGRIVFQSGTSSFQESAGIARVTVSREMGSVGRIRINFTLSTTSAVSGQDYRVEQNHIIMLNGQTQAQIEVTLIDDSTPELSEIIQLALTSVELLDSANTVVLPPGAFNPGNVEINIPPTLGASTIHTLTIEESDDPYGIIEFFQAVYSVNEGQLAQIQVNRLRGTIGVQSVQFTISEGEAKLVQDFNTGGGTLSGTLIFQERAASSAIQIQIVDDTTPEDTEKLGITLQSINGNAKFGNRTSAEVHIEISDDPFGVIGFNENSLVSRVTNPTVSEGPVTISLTVDRSRGTMGNVQVQYQMLPTAQLQQVHQDLSPTSGTLTFADGASQQFIIISILPEDGPEVEEHYIVSLVLSTGTLNMDRVNSSIFITGRGIPYGIVGFASGQDNLVFDEPEVSVEVALGIARTEGTYSSVLVYWEARGNVTSSDIKPLSGSVELPHWDGAISAYPLYNLNFLLLSDTKAEDTQVFTIQLTGTSAPTTIDPAADTVMITIKANDYPHGLFRIDPSSLFITLEQSSLTRVFSFTIVRAQGVLTDATLSYSISYTDPIQPGDTTLVASTLLIPDGQARMDSSFSISADTFIGTNGNVTITLTAVTALGTAVTNLPPRIDSVNSTVSLSVLEHQANARISFSPPSLSPTVDDVSNTAQVVLQREGNFGNVTISLVSGQTTPSLRNGVITPSAQFINFAPSDTNKTLSLLLSLSLDSVEPEIFTLRLVATDSSTVRALPHPTFDTSVIEPKGVVGFPAGQVELRVAEAEGFAVLDVLRLFGSSEPIFVSYSTQPVDSVNSLLFEELAVAGVDYTTTQGLLEFQQFQTRQKIRVPLLTDNVISGKDKLFRVILTAVVDSSSQLSASPRLRDGFMTSLVIIVDDDNSAGVFRFSESKLTVQEEFQLIVIPILRDSSDIIFPANVSVRTVTPDMGGSFGIDYNLLGVNFERTDNATVDLDYLPINEQLVYSLNDTTMQVSLRILDENIPEIDKLILLQLYDPSYKSMLSPNHSLISVIVQANDDSGGILRFSDSSLNLDISEDLYPSIQVTLSRDLSILGQVSIQWQAKRTADDTPATAEEISQLSTQLEFTSGVATFQAGEGTANFTLSLKPDTVPELMVTFYILLLSESIQPAAVLDQSRKLATVVSLQSDFPYGNIQFSPSSRYMAVTSSDSDFTIRLTVQRVGGNLGNVIINYNTPAVTQGNTTIGSYIPSPAQISNHYLSADGVLNLTDGRTEATIQVTILGNPLSAGEIRFFHVLLSPLPPAESFNLDYLRSTIYITGHGNQLQLLEIYSEQLNGVALASEISASLLKFLTDEQTSTAARVEAQVIRAVVDQLITDGASGSYALQETLQDNILRILNIIIGGGNFPGYAFFADVIESFSYSILESQPCPMQQPVELKSSRLEIQALKQNLSSLYGYQFTSNGHTFQLPKGLLASDAVGICGQTFLAEISLDANSIFRDPGLDRVFRQSVLSVGVRDSSRNRITSLPSPVTYRFASSGDLVKLKNSRCLFWDFDDSKWSTSGCVATRQPIETQYIECQCNHLTNFASDVITDGRYSFGVAMAVLCGLVILAVLFSISIHLLYYTKFQLITHLIMNLLLAIFLCEVTFLLASVLSPTADDSSCVAIGVALHYFTLVIFLWCLLIVVAIILVIYYGALAYEYVQLLLYALFGWLTPGIVILLTLFIVRYGLGFEWSQVYGDVYGNGDICFIPNQVVNIITSAVPISLCFLISLFGIILLFLMTGMSNNQDLKFDNIYFTSKNTTEVLKLLGLLIVIGATWVLCAIHLIFGQHYTLAFALMAQLVLALYIAVVYGVLVIYVFLSARRKSYYPQEDINDINGQLPPVAPMSFEVQEALSPATLMEEKIYTIPSITDASSILDSSYPPSDVLRNSAVLSEDPEVEDLIYTMKVGDLDQDSYFQNGDSNSDPSIQEVFTKRRISIADTHL